MLHAYYLEFYFMNPNLPLENLCNRLDNYHYSTESQKELSEYAKRLLYLGKSTKAGLFIWGDPGVGKTHIAVALTKEFMSKNQEVFYLSAENYQLPVHLGPEQVWILDDLNSPYGEYIKTFKKIVMNAHEKGGRVFVTSNTPYEELMNNAFALDPQEKNRYKDRAESLFKIRHVTGSSGRKQKAWYQ